MAEEIRENLFRIEVPLPRNPLKSLNSYVIRGERNLVIDTGFNQPECLEAMETGLAEIGIDRETTDFFITHLHADHFGLVSTLARKGSKIYFNRPEANFMDGGGSWQKMFSYAGVVGFPEDELKKALASHPGFKYGGEEKPEFTLLGEGDLLAYGDFEFRCLETPGHTRGHLCLYEPREKLLVSGDHILGDITPHIELWSDEENTLKDYLVSLDKINALEIDLCLPGHRALVKDCGKRIRELKEHHRLRADETCLILKDGRKNAYEVAAGMKWDVKYTTWESLYVAQRWFATGETVAHLKYVQEQGLVQRVEDGGKVFFEQRGVP